MGYAAPVRGCALVHRCTLAVVEARSVRNVLIVRHGLISGRRGIILTVIGQNITIRNCTQLQNIIGSNTTIIYILNQTIDCSSL